jgi:hypothetical protein
LLKNCKKNIIYYLVSKKMNIIILKKELKKELKKKEKSFKEVYQNVWYRKWR